MNEKELLAFKGMGLSEREQLILEDAFLISKIPEGDQNVFLYVNKDYFFKVSSSIKEKSFKSIEIMDGKEVKDFLKKGKVRDLFFLRMN